jgi:hypothetical protein
MLQIFWQQYFLVLLEVGIVLLERPFVLNFLCRFDRFDSLHIFMLVAQRLI